jgi:hypothetical protein
LNKTTIKLDEAKSKLSKYNTRNVNKRQKRLENKFLTTLTEIQELKNQCGNKDRQHYFLQNKDIIWLILLMRIGNEKKNLFSGN